MLRGYKKRNIEFDLINWLTFLPMWSIIFDTKVKTDVDAKIEVDADVEVKTDVKSMLKPRLMLMLKSPLDSWISPSDFLCDSIRWHNFYSLRICAGVCIVIMSRCNCVSYTCLRARFMRTVLQKTMFKIVFDAMCKLYRFDLSMCIVWTTSGD